MLKLSDKNRIVIKVGTSTLTHSTGMLNIRRVETLVKVIADLKNCGKEVILVTSGRITSYNVCYTKLLRDIVGGKAFMEKI